MNRGKKGGSPELKKLTGTYRADRHSNVVALTTATSAAQPVMPAYMSEEAKKVWQEELPRVIVCGATDTDSSIFARYCEMEAAFRSSIRNGSLPPIAQLTELRRSAELLGIGGLKSRLAKAAGNDAPTSSPFKVRPK